MSLKRSYQVQSKYTRGSKRARTLGSEVKKLKQQVATNKKELKYYDLTLNTTGSPYTEPYSIFWTNNSSSWPEFQSDRVELHGRKIRVMKLEINCQFVAGTPAVGDIVNIYRQSRPGKALNGTKWPLAYDPEYHSMIRQFDPTSDSTKTTHKATVDFGPYGRIIELDDPTDLIATDESPIGVQPDVTRGDIKIEYSGNSILSMRVWYHDD